MFEKLAEFANDQYLGLVVIGGFLGGALQPLVEKLRADKPDPKKASYWQSPLLGVAAAGISIYVLADSQMDDPMRLLFFALLCGLGFPSVLTSAIEKVGRGSASTTRLLERIADDAAADGIKETAEAARELRTVIAQNPPDAVRTDQQNLFEAVAQKAITNIAQTTADSAKDQRLVVGELRDVGTVAKTVGWDAAAKAAADQLKMLSDTIEDSVAKAAAESAAARLLS